MFSPRTAKLSSNSARSIKAFIVAFTLLNTNLSFADEKDALTLAIPVVSDARVFAEFKDKLPAVVNYFTHRSEQEVISFYQNEYGQIEQQERKRGRLTLNFNQAHSKIRVVISQQNKLRQVDVIVEEQLNN